MPELPEVETVRCGLERTILGKTVAYIEVRVLKLFPNDQSVIDRVLVGAKIVAIDRRAKVLLIDLSTDWTLAIHLKMTGQLIVEKSEEQRVKSEKKNTLTSLLLTSQSIAFVGGHPEKSYEQPLPHKHTHVIIEFTDGTHLYFNDLRKFGWLRLFPHEVANHAGHQGLSAFLESLNLGPEPLSADFTEGYLAALTKGRTIPIKQLLLQQKGISGIGNIYADEALFRSKIAPKRRANSVKRREIKGLHSAIREVLELGIKHGGTSKNTYLNVEGTRGEMQNHLMVYQRTEKPCIVCATPIEWQKIGGRSSHFCPKCQK